MKSIMFFIESLDGGGAEQILETLMLKIPQNRLSCTLFSSEECPFSKAPHKFFFRRTPHGFFQTLIKKIKSKFMLIAPETLVAKVFFKKKFDVEVAFCEGYATKLIGNSRRKKGVKKIAWVHTDVINNPWSESIFGSKEAEQACYRNFDAIVCISETMRESFIKKYGMAEKVHLIHNIIDIEKILNNAKEPPVVPMPQKKLNFIMVGRLVEVKGYDRIIRAASKLKKENYDFSISILGRGVLLDRLTAMSEELGLSDNICFMKYQTNPHSFMAQADAVICSSYAEGYSTTAVESLVLGKPFITTECSGMREIFGGSECGIICENSEEGLYNAIKSVLDNPEKLEFYSKNALERAKDFSTEKRTAELENFLYNI